MNIENLVYLGYFPDHIKIGGFMFPLGSAVNRLDDLKLIDNNGDLKDFYGFELSLDSISPTTIVCETKDIQEALRIFHQWLDKRGFLKYLKENSE